MYAKFFQYLNFNVTVSYCYLFWIRFRDFIINFHISDPYPLDSGGKGERDSLRALINSKAMLAGVSFPGMTIHTTQRER